MYICLLSVLSKYVCLNKIPFPYSFLIPLINLKWYLSFRSDGSCSDDSKTYSKTYPEKSSRKKQKSKTRNGHKVIDMTPPDKLLKKAEKKAKKYTKDKKVSLMIVV